MKKILTLAILSITFLTSCTTDDSNTTDPQNTGMVGHQFDLVVSKSFKVNSNQSAWAHFGVSILDPETGENLGHNGFPQYILPDVYWIASQVYKPGTADQSVITGNSTMQVRLVHVPKDLSFILYQHIPPLYVGENQYPYQIEMFINTTETYGVGHPKVSYYIDTSALQSNDIVEFHVGEHAEVPIYKVIRNGSIFLTNNVTQL